MSASEIRSNEVEGTRAPERETPSPSEHDKTKLQPSEHSDGNASGARDEANDGLKKNESEHPKLNNSEAHEGEHSNPKQGKEANEHPKIDTGNENKPANKGESPEATKVPEVENSRNNQPEDSASKENNKPKENVSEGGKDAQEEGASGESGKPKEDAPEGEDGITDKPEEGTSGEGSKPKEDASEGEGGKTDKPEEGTSEEGGKPKEDAPEGEGGKTDKPEEGTSGEGSKPKEDALEGEGGKTDKPEEGTSGEGSKSKGDTPEVENDAPDKNIKPSETEDPDYKNRYDRTPKNQGEWVNEDGTPGQRGESKFVPADPEVQKTLQDNGVDGIKYNDCYPDMSPVSKFDAYLEPDDYYKSDKDQFQMCNDSLADAVVPDPDTGEVENPELAAQFTPDQLADIEAGDTPDGYTWHHDVDSGHLQLVPTDVHQACRHSGGRSLWGGGADYR